MCALAGILLLGGCRREPVVQEEEETGQLIPITFGATAPSITADVTKAVREDGLTAFPAVGDKIVVYGDWTPPDYPSAAHVFKGKADGIVTCSTVGVGSSTWSYEQTKYWQWSGQYNFKAIYDPEFDVDYDANSTGKTVIVRYSMHKDFDLMAASVSRNVANSRAMVDFQFHHACAAGQFRFRKGDDVDTEYYLKSFELQNLRTVGTFYYTGQWSASDQWSLVLGGESLSMSTDGTWFICQEVQLTSTDEFVFRKAGDTPKDYHGTYVSLGTEFTVSDEGSGSITGVSEGTYDVFLNPDTGKAKILAHTDDDGPDITRSNWIVSDNRSPSVFSHTGLNQGIGKSYASMGQWHYVIPQDLEPGYDGSRPSVHFSVAVGGPDGSIVHTTIPLPTTYDDDGDDETPEVTMYWEPGQVYVYQILIQPTMATIEVKAVPWDKAYLSVDDVVFY